MTRIHPMKSLMRRFLATQLRKTVRHRTASALERLDDRSLAVIGIPRHRIVEPVSVSRFPIACGSRATIGVERMPDVHALQGQAANESEPLERRRQAAEI